MSETSVSSKERSASRGVSRGVTSFYTRLDFDYDTNDRLSIVFKLRKKLQKPTKPYIILLKKALLVRFFYTV